MNKFIALLLMTTTQIVDAQSWARGVENQRKADLGDGRFLNPILAGDHADPSVLKDGADYYMVHSSFDNTPGLLIWHSQDLVNWQPLVPALQKNVGTVWAPDITKYKGRYYIYFPALKGGGVNNMVVYADDIRGPWSEPVDLKVGNIDPGHAVGLDGKRYLFLGGGQRVPISEDGLSVTGPVEKVYEGWKYPEDWDVEGFAQEGPKILRHGKYYYMILAEGGTAGPPTSHMVVMARAKTLDGPWENSPYNPVVHTKSAEETWWSRGHATLVEGPNGKQWYLIYHAYEKGFYNLGRETLLEPVEWSADGWVKSSVTNIAQPLPMPIGGKALPHGLALSDDFSTNKMGIQWNFFRADSSAPPRFRYENGSLILKAIGHSPKDCSPLTFVAGDQAYEIQVEIDADTNASAGLLVFYNDRLFAGLGFSDSAKLIFRSGNAGTQSKPKGISNHYFVRLRNDRHVVTLWYSADGKTWTKHGGAMEVSSYHHNVAGGFLSLRPGLFAAGSGEVRFRNFTYQALP